MLGAPYVHDGYDEAFIRELLRGLTGLGAKCAVLTGVSFEPGTLGVMSYDARADRYFSYFREEIPVRFHGTGDVFASSMVGALMNDLSLDEALKVAVDYTFESIALTVTDPGHRWYGVNFEQALPMLLQRLAPA